MKYGNVVAFKTWLQIGISGTIQKKKKKRDKWRSRTHKTSLIDAIRLQCNDLVISIILMPAKISVISYVFPLICFCTVSAMWFSWTYLCFFYYYDDDDD